MDQKSIRKFSVPSAANVAMGSSVNVGDANFELKPTLINMVQANSLCGKPYDDVC